MIIIARINRFRVVADIIVPDEWFVNTAFDIALASNVANQRRIMARS